MKPKGLPKTGGRAKGVKNKDKQAIIDLAVSKGQTPLEYLLEQLNDDSNSTSVRIDASKAAAPFVHRKMPLAVEADVKGSMTVTLLKLDEDL